MATQFLTRIGQLGLGMALAGGVVNSALYNGKLLSAVQGSILWVYTYGRNRLNKVNV